MRSCSPGGTTCGSIGHDHAEKGNSRAFEAVLYARGFTSGSTVGVGYQNCAIRTSAECNRLRALEEGRGIDQNKFKLAPKRVKTAPEAATRNCVLDVKPLLSIRKQPAALGRDLPGKLSRRLAEKERFRKTRLVGTIEMDVQGRSPRIAIDCAHSLLGHFREKPGHNCAQFGAAKPASES